MTGVPLQNPTTIGPYQVLSKLGEGGMGEVYRARDTRLNRDVAIKVLPEAFALDADRLARFTREAQVLASLNHPNIAGIYGIEDNAIVMELVDGVDLSEMIGGHGHSAPAAAGPSESSSRGPAARGGGAPRAMNIENALRIAAQIADALEAAHEQGIVHRDLKPQNIKVRDDGTVKVLDFGLARTLDTTPGTQNPSNSPTLTARGTQMGMIIGTAAYMSPEQAKGKAVDKRADIWAFGVVLYEMLTGTRAFKGDDVSETLASVLKDTPDVGALPASTPLSIQRLIARCLERDLKRRLRDIGEARLILEDPSSSAAQSAPVAAVAHPSFLSRALPWTLAAAMTIVALGSWAPWRSVPGAAEGLTARFQLTLPAGVTPAGVANQGSMAISPDGRTIALLAAPKPGAPWQIWLRPIDVDEVRALAGTENALTPFWSPDGKSLAFFHDDGLKRVDIATGVVSTICACASFASLPLANRSGTWGADNVILLTGAGPLNSLVLYRVSASGGSPSPLTTLDAGAGDTQHAYPSFLPDGRHYLFIVIGAEAAGIYVGTVGSSERTFLQTAADRLDLTAVRYAAPGYLMWVSDHRLVARAFDLQTMKVSGEPIPIAEGFGRGGPGQPAFAVSETGVLAFRPVGEFQHRQPTWISRTGVTLGTVGAPGPYAGGDLSPDERTLAVHRQTEKEVTLWAIDMERGTTTRFTTDGYSQNPMWFPTGDKLAYTSVRDTPPNPFMRTLAGVETRLLRRLQNWQMQDVSPDGKSLVMWMGNHLYLVSTAGDEKVEPFLETPYNTIGARVAPNGKQVALLSDESGALELYVTTFPKAGRLVRVSTTGSTSSPRWRGDGAELYFQSGRALMAVAVSPDPAEPAGVRLGPPKKLFDLPPNTTVFLPSKDGQRFLVTVQVAEAAPAPTTVIVNWAKGLGK